jgi:transposase
VPRGNLHQFDAKAQKNFTDPERSYGAAAEVVATFIVHIEMSKARWLVSGAVPGVERERTNRVRPPTALDAPLARRLIARGIEAHVIHSASVAV